jgi:hypothetical protein
LSEWAFQADVRAHQAVRLHIVDKGLLWCFPFDADMVLIEVDGCAEVLVLSPASLPQTAACNPFHRLRRGFKTLRPFAGRRPGL